MTSNDQQNPVKANVAFKCDPGIKTKLTKEAKELGMSLSEYPEGIIANHYNPDKAIDKPKTDKELTNTNQDMKTCFDEFETKLSGILGDEILPVIASIDEIKDMLQDMGASTDKPDNGEALKTLTEQNENLTRELDAITGNEGLQQLYEKYKGKSLNYKTRDGEAKKIKVESYSDIITALVESISDKQ